MCCKQWQKFSISFRILNLLKILIIDGTAEICNYVIIKLNQQKNVDKLVRYLFVSCRTNFFYQKSWLFDTTLRRRLEVKPYNKESFISKGNQLIINCARSWQSPTYLVCCGWLHDVPPMLFILPQLKWNSKPASGWFSPLQVCSDMSKSL